jgi:hypothetical protein
VEHVVPTRRWRNIYKVSVRKHEVKGLWSSFSWLANKSPSFIHRGELLWLAPVRRLCCMKFTFIQTPRPGGHYPHVTWARVILNACSWYVRGDLTLNYMAQIHTSFTPFTSRDLAWSSGRLTCQHASQICAVAHISWHDVRVERSSDVISCFQKWRKCLLQKCANGPFYMTPSHKIIEISLWEATRGKG